MVEFDIAGAQLGLVLSIVVWMNCLYAMLRDSFCWPKLMFVGDCSALSFLFALALFLFMCWVKFI